LLPVGAAQHAHHGGCHRRPFTPGDAVEVYGATRIQPFDGGTFERRRDRGGIRHHGDADIGLQQLDQIAFRSDFMATIHIKPMFAKRSVRPRRMLAVIPREQLLGAKIDEVDFIARRQRMVFVDDELKVFGEQRPGVEPVPLLADLGGNAELGFALLEKLGDFAGVAAQKAELQAVEQPLDLVEMRNQQ